MIFEDPQKQPSKQGRMFHMDLGQNDGPFKERHKEKTTPEQTMIPAISYKSIGLSQEGILFNNDLLQNNEESVDSVKKLTHRILSQYNESRKVAELCKQEADQVKEEFHELLNTLVNENEDILTDVHPNLKTKYKNIKHKIKQQKDENEHLIKELISLRKETAQLKQQITSCEFRIHSLEKNILEPGQIQTSFQHEESLNEYHSQNEDDDDDYFDEDF